MIMNTATAMAVLLATAVMFGGLGISPTLSGEAKSNVLAPDAPQDTTASLTAEVKPSDSTEGSTKPKRLRVVGSSLAATASAARQASDTYRDEAALRGVFKANATPLPQSPPDANGTLSDQIQSEATTGSALNERESDGTPKWASLKSLMSDGTPKWGSSKSLIVQNAALPIDLDATCNEKCKPMDKSGPMHCSLKHPKDFLWQDFCDKTCTPSEEKHCEVKKASKDLAKVEIETIAELLATGGQFEFVGSLQAGVDRGAFLGADDDSHDVWPGFSEWVTFSGFTPLLYKMDDFLQDVEHVPEDRTLPKCEVDFHEKGWDENEDWKKGDIFTKEAIHVSKDGSNLWVASEWNQELLKVGSEVTKEQEERAKEWNKGRFPVAGHWDEKQLPIHAEVRSLIIKFGVKELYSEKLPNTPTIQFAKKDERNADDSDVVVGFRLHKEQTGAGTEQLINYILFGERGFVEQFRVGKLLSGVPQRSNLLSLPGFKDNFREVKCGTSSLKYDCIEFKEGQPYNVLPPSKFQQQDNPKQWPQTLQSMLHPANEVAPSQIAKKSAIIFTLVAEPSQEDKEIAIVLSRFLVEEGDKRKYQSRLRVMVTGGTEKECQCQERIRNIFKEALAKVAVSKKEAQDNTHKSPAMIAAWDKAWKDLKADKKRTTEKGASKRKSKQTKRGQSKRTSKAPEEGDEASTAKKGSKSFARVSAAPMLGVLAVVLSATAAALEIAGAN